MNKLNGLKFLAVSTIALLSISTIAVNKAFAQEKPKLAPQAEPMSGCGCCKKMMEPKPNSSQNSMPGMNHPAPVGK